MGLALPNARGLPAEKRKFSGSFLDYLKKIST